MGQEGARREVVTGRESWTGGGGGGGVFNKRIIVHLNFSKFLKSS